MAFLQLDQHQKSFGPVQVVHNFDMGIDKGEFVLLPRPLRLRQDDHTA